MTQQEAYIQLASILEQMQKLYTEAKDLADEHDLQLKCLSYKDPVPETIDPSRLTDGDWGKRFKDDDPEYPGEYIHEVWQNSTEMGC